MKAKRITTLSVFCFFLFTSAVTATPITFSGSGSSSVSLSNFEWGVTLDVPVIGDVTVGQWSSLSATLSSTLATQSFTIDEGEFKRFPFFTLTSDGAGWGSYDIFAKLAFDNQSISAGVAGEGSWGGVTWNIPYFWDFWNGTSYFSGGITGGELDWDYNSITRPGIGGSFSFLFDYDDPFDHSDYYQLIDNNMIGLFLEDGLDMGLSETLTVHAWVFNFGEIDEEIAPIPEPSTFILLGGGLVGLAFATRRRRKE